MRPNPLDQVGEYVAFESLDANSNGRRQGHLVNRDQGMEIRVEGNAGSPLASGVGKNLLVSRL
jgi:hypothetical protein